MYTNAAARGARALGQRRALAAAAAAVAGPSTSTLSKRAYAVPVNRKTSVDPLLGIAPPPAPTPQPQAQAAEKSAKQLEVGTSDKSSEAAFAEILGLKGPNGTARSNNPNDLSELLRGKRAASQQHSRHRNTPKGPAPSETETRGAKQREPGSAIPTQSLQHNALEKPRTTSRKGQKTVTEETVEPRRTSDGTVDREHPHSIDALYGRNDLDERILAAARALHHARQAGQVPGKDASALSALMDGFRAHNERTLSIELPNESSPTQDRRVPVSSALSDEAELERMSEDGVLLIAYVTGLDGARGQERISVCSGFAIEGGDRLRSTDSQGTGPLVVTCAHTLRQASHGINSANDSSIALAVTRTGQVLPITTLLSSLPMSDLVLLQLGERAIVVDETAVALGAGAPLRSSPITLRTLPVNPYPAPVGSELCVSSFWGWEDDASSVLPAFEFQAPSSAPPLAPDTTTVTGSAASSTNGGGGLMTHSATDVDTVAALTISSKPMAAPLGREKEQVKRERDDAGRSRWGRARLVEYRDASGQEAQAGTYDELAQLDFALLHDNAHNPPALQQKGSANWPPPGSSGGPIVDAQSGSVVGVTRGTKMGVLQGRRGDAIPAERIFFMFALPGFGKKGGEGSGASS